MNVQYLAGVTTDFDDDILCAAAARRARQIRQQIGGLPPIGLAIVLSSLARPGLLPPCLGGLDAPLPVLVLPHGAVRDDE